MDAHASFYGQKLKEHGLILKVHQGPPVSYLQMLWALEQCALVLTDSGGLQKEAFFMKRPCITLRNETEWVELLEIGANELFTSNDSNLAKSIERMKSKEINYTLRVMDPEMQHCKSCKPCFTILNSF